MNHIGLRITSTTVAVFMAISAFLTACGPFDNNDPGPVLESDETIDGGNALMVETNIDVNSSANLTIHDGADSLLYAQFTYNEKLEPDLSYAVRDNRGVLEIDQPSQRNLDRDKLENEWDLQFGNNTPIDLEIDVSSGNTMMEISTAQLTSINIHTSSGSVESSLGGQQNLLEQIVAESSSGNIALDLNGTFDLLDLVEVDVSSGNVSLVLDGDYRALDRVTIDSSSGNTRVDVGGVWANDLEADFRTSSGNVTLVVPVDTGVWISVDVSSGQVNASGFRLDGDAYVNDAYGVSNVTLRFEIDVSSGNVNLEFAE